MSIEEKIEDILKKYLNKNVCITFEGALAALYKIENLSFNIDKDILEINGLNEQYFVLNVNIINNLEYKNNILKMVLDNDISILIKSIK